MAGGGEEIEFLGDDLGSRCDEIDEGDPKLVGGVRRGRDARTLDGDDIGHGHGGWGGGDRRSQLRVLIGGHRGIDQELEGLDLVGSQHPHEVEVEVAVSGFDLGGGEAAVAVVEPIGAVHIGRVGVEQIAPVAVVDTAKGGADGALVVLIVAVGEPAVTEFVAEDGQEVVFIEEAFSVADQLEGVGVDVALETVAAECL